MTGCTETSPPWFSVQPSRPIGLSLFRCYSQPVVGYLSHLVGDACTPSGVPLLWPSPRPYSLRLFATGGMVEHAAVSVLALLVLLITGIA